MKRIAAAAVFSVLLVLLLSGTAFAAQGNMGKVTASTSLNMREEADTDSDVILKIPAKAHVVIISEGSKFYKVKYEGKTGYASKDYVTLLKHYEAEATENVNMRTRASTESKSLGVVRDGSKFFVYSTSDKFYLCVVGTTKCYVAKDYVKLRMSESEDENSYLSDDYNGFDPESTDYYIDDFESFSAEDIYMVAQLIYSEGNNQSDLSYQAMASLVYNRVASSKFPSEVNDVVFQKNQFSYPARNPEKFLEIEPSERAIEAAIKVFGEGKALLPPQVLFFKSATLSRSWGSHTYYATIGANMYYKY